MESGFGDLVILVLGIWLFIFSSFGFSFVKNKYVSTLSFMIFIIISAYFSYGTSAYFGYGIAGTIIDIVSSEISLIAIVPIICLILIVISSILWFIKRKTVARWLGIINILSTMCVSMLI